MISKRQRQRQGAREREGVGAINRLLQGQNKSVNVIAIMEKTSQKSASPRHPPWLKVRAPFGEGVHDLKRLLADLKLHTVCEEAHCPNMGECWDHGVATFMILGKICTRGCRYCAVSKGAPRELDRQEPRRVAEAVRVMGLQHAVITSVDRDDLEDGGSAAFAETVSEIRRLHPDCVVEVLDSRLQGI